MAYASSTVRHKELHVIFPELHLGPECEEVLYLNSAKHCIIRPTECECIKNTSCKATCCIRIIPTIPIYTITNAFKQYKEYSHKSQL